MVKALFDTNILIDYLNGVSAAKDELERYTEPSSKAISAVTWMEVMAGTTAATEAVTRDFLQDFKLHAIDEAVSERAVTLRRVRGIKLPDAIIWATALVHDRLLVSRNVKDFAANVPGIRVPYQL